MIETWADFRKAPLEEQLKYVEERREQGYTDKEICQELGTSEGVLGHWKAAHGQRRWETKFGRKPQPDEAHFYKKPSLCWKCKNATGGCSWSNRLQPVEGWTASEEAEPQYISEKMRSIPNYRVIDCPEYVKG